MIDLNNVSSLAGGLSHTVYISNNGSALSFGLNGDGQLGLGDTFSRGIPTLVSISDFAIKAICGSYHSFIVTNTSVYGFGRNNVNLFFKIEWSSWDRKYCWSTCTNRNSNIGKYETNFFQLQTFFSPIF